MNLSLWSFFLLFVSIESTLSVAFNTSSCFALVLEYGRTAAVRGSACSISYHSSAGVLICFILFFLNRQQERLKPLIRADKDVDRVDQESISGSAVSTAHHY